MRIDPRRSCLLLVSSALFLALACGPSDRDESPPRTDESPARTDESPARTDNVRSVRRGDVVHIEYTLQLIDGTELGSSYLTEPLAWEQGTRAVPIGLDDGVLGMRVGETKRLVLPPDMAYGRRSAEALREVEPERVPEDGRQPGRILSMQDPDGSVRVVRIHEVREDKIVIDENHPLGGETVVFEVTLFGIE